MIRELSNGCYDADMKQYRGGLSRSPRTPDALKIADAIDAFSARLDNHQIDRHGAFDPELLSDLFAIGLFSMTLPKKYGGTSLSMTEFCAITTKVSFYDPAMGVTLVPHSGMGIKSILFFGNEAQQDRVFKTFIENKQLISFVLTESGAGSDINGIKTTLLDGTSSDTMLLDGLKILITNAQWASWLMVVARSPSLTSNPDGLTFVLVNKNNPNIVISTPYDKMGIRASNTCDIQFNNVTVQKSDIIGDPGKGLQQFNVLVNSGRMGVAAGLCGLLARAITIAQTECKHLAPDVLRRWESALFLCDAVTALAAFKFDAGTSDVTVHTGIVKAYVTQRTWEMVNEIVLETGFDSFLDDSGVGLKFRECPISRITEIVLYRCGLDLLMSISSNVKGEASIIPFVDQDLIDIAQECNILVKSLYQLGSEIVAKHKYLSNRQITIDSFVSALTGIYVVTAALLYGSSETDAITANRVLVKDACILACQEAKERLAIALFDTRSEQCTIETSFSIPPIGVADGLSMVNCNAF
jgi:alkylation response protein AidB-like acyl-CoA dehydrogenase